MSDKFQARKDGFEGKLFYNNKIGNSQYVKKYFPPAEGELASSYNRRPKIAVPISSSIINRIVNILNFNTVVSLSDQKSQNLYDEMDDKLKLSEVHRDILVNMLSTGNNLTLFRLGYDYPEIEQWDGTFLNLDYGINMIEYTIKNGVIVPVLSTEVKEEEVIRIMVDDILFGDVEHNLGFNPSVLAKSIDKYEDGIYGKSFVMRFKDMAVEFNQIFSQIAKAVKILQNVWTTNLLAEDPYNPIMLAPEHINFLGPDGKLEQAVRNLDLKEERMLLESLEFQISKASQVPAELIGLRDVSKLPSGIALQIILQPLTELIERLRPLYVSIVSEFTEKIVRMKYICDGKKAPEVIELNIRANENLFPEDKKEKIDEIITLKKEGLITEQQAKLLIEPYLKLDLLEKGL